MVGPVLSQELLLGSRRGRQHLFRRIYTGLLMVQLAFFYWLYAIQSNMLGHKFFDGEINGWATAEFAGGFVATLLRQHIVLLLLATPAFTAGAVTDEKTSGTLQYLLAADLTSWEIVLGKLLGRVVQVFLLALCALPVMCFIGVWGGLNVVLLVALAAVTVAPVFAIGAASLLASVWSRQTRDAVLGVYLCGGLGYLILWQLDYVYLFNPLYVLEPAWGGTPDLRELVKRLVLSALCWGGVAGLCLGVAGWRLRTTYLRQLEGEGRPKKLRWWRARRAAVSDEPIRWKERHVEGLAPLAWLRRLPRWLGITVIFTGTLASSLAIIYLALRERHSQAEILTAIAEFKVWQLSIPAGTATGAFIAEGLVALLGATLLVGMRCSGAVTGERERQTWEALLLTPLPAEFLVRGKLWGIIGASYPYLLAYFVPAFLCALFADVKAAGIILLLAGITWLAMAFVGAAGIWCSVRSKGSWRSLLGTALIGYVGGFFLTVIMMPVALLVWAIIWVTLALIDLLSNNQTGFASLFSGTFGAFQVGTCLAAGGAFLFATHLFLRSAQRYIALRERIRHWHDEPKSRPRRPRREKVHTPDPLG
jgi:ABC-type transport system involved in multi-copper enzyme maturation permease subunit